MYDIRLGSCSAQMLRKKQESVKISQPLAQPDCGSFDPPKYRFRSDQVNIDSEPKKLTAQRGRKNLHTRPCRELMVPYQ
jgi:hypothetical protein